MTLTEFAAARLDEKEQAVITSRDAPADAMRFVDADRYSQPLVSLADEDRALREVAAGRKRLALMAEATTEMDKLLADQYAGRVDQAMAIGRARAATVAVKLDAAVDSGHPDYDPAWRPA